MTTEHGLVEAHTWPVPGYPTSVVVDREGVVRWAHGGGEYHASQDPRHAACEVRLHDLERTIERLLGDASAAR